MSKKMLIDAAHAEETRVVVVDGTRIEEFDFESRSKKQLRGNIYLAKVTRVEPSLQAAFIEYGGNRHGFLAFNEIHPDYYQIPMADREALMRDELDDADDHHLPAAHDADDGEPGDRELDDDDVMEEEVARRRRRLMRKYKIQEVIKRRQIMLIQVVKEERGNKGAALTTYLSLAGRYGVLMPNTARGGGISRKITTVTDRKRLKSVVQSLDVPQGMGLIVRTAGAKRTKAEIKRDYEYLLRLWENIRDVTLHSTAPALIYEEEDLVKRAIRDMYDKELEGIWVEGEAGYREAKEFMRMLMPSQAKKVMPYREATPLFVKHKIEDQLAQIYTPVVPLRSGGYLVINQTEALVAVDVNSGKSTRERNIEATALKTNMEAAEEAARQLRLRDLAGLVVIDFIDMDESKNNRAVEKKLKDCLKDDRARIQMGKISSFGLMEISRQRRRSGVLEGTTHICEHCAGVGRVRSVESSALAALRSIEMEAVRDGAGAITLKVPQAVGLYILNEKRVYLERVRLAQGLFVTIMIDESLSHADHEIERTETREFEPRPEDLIALGGPLALPFDDSADDLIDDDDEEEDEEFVASEDDSEDDEDGEDEAPARAAPRNADRPERAERPEEAGDDSEAGRRRRRRRRRGRRGDEPSDRAPSADGAEAAEGEDDEASDGTGDGAEGSEARDGDANDGEAARRRRRRGRRGGRRMREDVRTEEPYGWTRPRAPDGDPYIWFDPLQPRPRPVPVEGETVAVSEPAAEPLMETAAVEVAEPVATEEAIKPAKARRRRPTKAELKAEAEAEAAPEAVAAPAEMVDEGSPASLVTQASPVAEDIWVELPPVAEAAAKPARARRSRAKPKADAEAVSDAEASAPETPAVAVAATEAPLVEASGVEAPEVEVQAVAEPAAIVEPEPAPAPEPAAPTAPAAPAKKGWWRRG
jgi:ribonuclease E